MSVTRDGKKSPSLNTLLFGGHILVASNLFITVFIYAACIKTAPNSNEILLNVINNSFWITTVPFYNLVFIVCA